MLLTPDGGMATWKGAGVGKFGEGGAVSYRGAVYFTTATPKLARLNSCATLFEFEVDPQGNTHTKNWEWSSTGWECPPIRSQEFDRAIRRPKRRGPQKRWSALLAALPLLL